MSLLSSCSAASFFVRRADKLVTKISAVFSQQFSHNVRQNIRVEEMVESLGIISSPAIPVRAPMRTGLARFKCSRFYSTLSSEFTELVEKINELKTKYAEMGKEQEILETNLNDLTLELENHEKRRREIYLDLRSLLDEYKEHDDVLMIRDELIANGRWSKQEIEDHPAFSLKQKQKLLRFFESDHITLLLK